MLEGDPRIEICLNCTRKRCSGSCKAVRGEGAKMRYGTRLLFEGEMLSVAEIARRTGLNDKTLYRRLRQGMPLEEAARKAPTWGRVTAVELTARRLGVGLVAAWYMRLRGEG